MLFLGRTSPPVCLRCATMVSLCSPTCIVQATRYTPNMTLLGSIRYGGKQYVCRILCLTGLLSTPHRRGSRVHIVCQKTVYYEDIAAIRICREERIGDKAPANVLQSENRRSRPGLPHPLTLINGPETSDSMLSVLLRIGRMSAYACIVRVHRTFRSQHQGSLGS